MRLAFLLLAAALAAPAFVQAAEQRVALVIGNSGYKESPLANPGNDAADMAKALGEMGFKVILRRNANARAMREAIREFGQELRRAQVGLFYYAGHGVQVRSSNYLIPVGADIRGEADVEDQGIDAAYVLRTMEDAQSKVNIVILDACRNNPYASGFRSASRGLAQMTAATGTLIAFSTAPGSVAQDGSGRNGLYTQHLLANLRQADSDVLKVFQRTRAGVVKDTAGRQTPWESTSLTGDFYFRSGTQVAGAASSTSAIPASPTDSAAVEMAFWNSIRSSTNAADFDEYLRQFPNGRFSGLANNRLAELRRPAPSQVAVAAPAIPQIQRPSAPTSGTGSLRAQGSFPAKDIRTTAFLNVMKDIESAPHGVEFETLPAGAVAPAFALVDAVAKKTLAAAWIAPLYVYGKDNAFALVEGAPFGLEAGNYVAWRNNSQVARIIEGMYRKLGVVGLLCGITSPHGDIWVKKPINKLDDFKGLKIRAIGIHIDIFTKVGARVNALPGGEIVPAMDRGLLDAAIFGDPSTDVVLGLPAVSSVYMIGQLTGARALDLAINAELWDGMQPETRNAITAACNANVNKMIAENTRIAVEAIREMQKTVKIYKMTDAVISALRGAWNEVRADRSAKNPVFAELVATMAPYDGAALRPNLSAYGLKSKPPVDR